MERLWWAPGIQPGSTHHTGVKEPTKRQCHICWLLYTKETVGVNARLRAERNATTVYAGGRGHWGIA